MSLQYISKYCNNLSAAKRLAMVATLAQTHDSNYIKNLALAGWHCYPKRMLDK